MIDDNLGADSSVYGDFGDVRIDGENYFLGDADDVHADVGDVGHNDHYSRTYFV